MCGRLNLSDLDGIRQLMAQIGMPLFSDDRPPRYNVAPSAELQVLAQHNGVLGESDEDFSWRTARWGMPIRTASGAREVFNARSETVAEKPLFRSLIGGQRLVVPATGFYEWTRRGTAKQAYHFSPSTLPALLMAGVWRRTDEGRVEAAIVTTAANADISAVHDRMPLLLTESTVAKWLARDDSWESVMAPPPPGLIQARAVASHVNNASVDGPECLDDPETEPFTPDLFG
ncbi:MAG: SOS response-associated peptidase [Pseudomonadota bacterium]